MSPRIITGNALDVLAGMADESVHCVVTSPPYWGLRAYGGDPGMIGLEPTFDEHLENLVAVFREVRRVLREDGTLWLNYGDAYANDGKWGGSTGGKHAAGLHGQTGIGRQKVTTGLKPKDLMMMPARVAMALQSDGWFVRSEIVWHKPNPMPESVTDRPTSAHEKVFLLTKNARYFYDAEAVKTLITGPERDSMEARKERLNSESKSVATKERRGLRHNRRRAEPPRHEKYETGHSGLDSAPRGTANRRNVWKIPTAPYKGAHFATFPPALVELCIKAGCPKGGTVLDPFGGSGTTGLVAERLQRAAILIEINSEYADMARSRIQDDAPLLTAS